MIKYSLFGDRVSKRVFGMELLNVINSGKHFVKSGMEVSNIGGTKGLQFSVSDGEYYFNGSKVSFSVQTKQLTTPGVGKYKLTGLYVDANGVLSSSDGIVSNSLGSVKSPVINSATNFCIAVVLITGNAVGVNDTTTIFDISIVNDYFNDIYMDSTMYTIAESNIDDIFELQTLFKGTASYTPVENPWTVSDWFTDATGKMNTIVTANTTAIFDTNKYKMTFGTSTLVRDISCSRNNYNQEYALLNYYDITPAYINDIRILAYAACSSVPWYHSQGGGNIKLIYEDDTYFTTEMVYTYAYYSSAGGKSDYYRVENQIILDYSKKVKRVEYWAYASGSGNWIVNYYAACKFTVFNELIEADISSTSEDITHTKMISNINTTDTMPCPIGDGKSAIYYFTGGAMSNSNFKYDLYDASDNVQSGLSFGVKNAITGLTSKPIKMVIKITPPTMTGWASYTQSINNYDNIPLIAYITGKPYINDFCLITYEE